MQHTRQNLSSKTRAQVKRQDREPSNFTLSEITEKLSDTDRVKLLEDQTEVQREIFSVKRSVFNIGKILSKAKARLPHGYFIRWIKLSFGDDLPYSTAYLYMKIYEMFKDHKSIIEWVPMKYLVMITSKEFPAEIIRVLKRHKKEIGPAALQQIGDNYHKYKKGELSKSRLIKLSEKQILMACGKWKGETKHRINQVMRLSITTETKDILRRITTLRATACEMAESWPYDPASSEHRKLLAEIDNTIKELQNLKADLEGGPGFLKQISTSGGDKYVSNL